MVKELSQISVQILHQVKGLITQLSDDDYSRPLDLLSSNTIARHVRHVLEMYDEMISGIGMELIDYDARKRNLLIEHNREYTLQFISDMEAKLEMLEADKPLQLCTCYDIKTGKMIVNTSINRELAYNIEHAIHHMAIIQISVKHAFSHITLPAGFGVTFSTLAYQQAHVHTNLHS
jgi:uncharacterized damage-inducible protein DinB